MQRRSKDKTVTGGYIRPCKKIALTAFSSRGDLIRIEIYEPQKRTIFSTFDIFHRKNLCEYMKYRIFALLINLNLQTMKHFASQFIASLLFVCSAITLNAQTPGSVETFTVKGVSFDMVKVNSTFSIGKTEVTQELWTAVMGTNPSKFIGEKNPVEMVTWYECEDFCEKLSDLTGRTFRMPTEAEWVEAARGGTKSEGYAYSGSDDLDRVGWYESNSGGVTHPVGQKSPNELGIYDMSGNVWEWCSNREYNTNRGLRGGSYSCVAEGCRIDFLSWGPPANRFSFHGLRLAL